MATCNLDNIRIVLTNPIYGGNIGSVCRAMSNMGLSDLVIADPRPFDMNEARMMACHAHHILDGRREVATLREAVADCTAVFGTSAREGLYRQHARTPREWAPRVLEVSVDHKAALVFGREDNGLNNDELALCTEIIRIPTGAANASLNVAMAVMVCAYEVFAAAGVFEVPPEKSPEAPAELRERMFDIWRELLLEIGFMQEDKADHMMLGLRRVLARGARSVDDVKIMMGIARQSDWAARNGVIPERRRPET